MRFERQNRCCCQPLLSTELFRRIQGIRLPLSFSSHRHPFQRALWNRCPQNSGTHFDGLSGGCRHICFPNSPYSLLCRLRSDYPPQRNGRSPCRPGPLRNHKTAVPCQTPLHIQSYNPLYRYVLVLLQEWQSKPFFPAVSLRKAPQ